MKMKWSLIVITFKALSMHLNFGNFFNRIAIYTILYKQLKGLSLQPTIINVLTLR